MIRSWKSLDINLINGKSLDTSVFIESMGEKTSDEISQNLVNSYETIVFQALILICDLIAKKLQELKIKEMRICIFKTDYDDNGLYDGVYVDWIDGRKKSYSYSLLGNTNYIQDHEKEMAYDDFLDNENCRARANVINESLNEIFYNDNLTKLGVNSYFFNEFMQCAFTPNIEENIKNTMGQKELEIFKSLKEKMQLEKNTKLVASSAPLKTGKI